MEREKKSFADYARLSLIPCLLLLLAVFAKYHPGAKECVKSWIREVNYFVFHKSDCEDVIIGKKDWLYYNCVADQNPINIYDGSDLFTEEQLEEMAQHCLKQREIVEKTGAEFVIFIAPDKMRAYAEYMPDPYGDPARLTRTMQVFDYLKEHTDLRVLYPYEEILQAKEKVDCNIYYKSDSHWNWVGGYVGASALLRELGIDMPALDSQEVQIVAGDYTSGDLAMRLNLLTQLQHTDRQYSIEGYDRHDLQCLEWDIATMMHYTAQGADPRTIYVIRDSFATHMSEYIASQFEQAYLRHESTYSYKELQDIHPDIVVYELVERYVGILGHFKLK